MPYIAGCVTCDSGGSDAETMFSWYSSAIPGSCCLSFLAFRQPLPTRFTHQYRFLGVVFNTWYCLQTCCPGELDRVSAVCQPKSNHFDIDTRRHYVRVLLFCCFVTRQSSRRHETPRFVFKVIAKCWSTSTHHCVGLHSTLNLAHAASAQLALFIAEGRLDYSKIEPFG